MNQNERIADAMMRAETIYPSQSTEKERLKQVVLSLFQDNPDAVYIRPDVVNLTGVTVNQAAHALKILRKRNKINVTIRPRIGFSYRLNNGQVDIKTVISGPWICSPE